MYTFTLLMIASYLLFPIVLYYFWSVLSRGVWGWTERVRVKLFVAVINFLFPFHSFLFAIYLYIAEIFVTGHRVYQKGTVAFHAIVEEFGSSIVTDSGEIDRKKLGAIVFSDMVIESF